MKLSHTLLIVAAIIIAPHLNIWVASIVGLFYVFISVMCAIDEKNN